MSLLTGLADRLDTTNRQNTWRDNPAAWVDERLGEHLWSGQVRIVESVRDNRRTAVKACHGPGKSFTAARLAAWWIDTHPVGEAMVVSTAPTWAQVKTILWREVRRAHKAGGLAGEILQTCEWKIGDDLVGIGRKPADHDEHGFQGIHLRYVLVIIDEACGVPAQLWNAVHALTTNEDCRTLAIGNPDDPTSQFAKVCAPDSGWNVITIPATDTPHFTGEPIPDELAPLLVSKLWVEEAAAMWGDTSPIYTAKVLAEFPESTLDTVIPYAWVRAAQDRWREWEDEGAAHGTLDQLGQDVAGGGLDRCVMARRYGDIIDTLETWQGPAARDTMQTAGRVAAHLTSGVGVIDWIGVGQGVYDRLAEQGHRVVPFVASAATDLVDSRSGVGFVNSRSASWWALRERLDPDKGGTLALPPDDTLAAELIAPRWEMTSAGKIKVESKADVKARLGRSPDLADAVVLAVWPVDAVGGDEWVDVDDLDPDAIVTISAY